MTIAHVNNNDSDLKRFHHHKEQSSQIAITRAAHQSGREAVHWSNGVLGQRMGVDRVLCTQGLVQ